MPIVNGLAEEYAGKLAFEVVKTTDPGAAERITNYGFDIHGMVIVDQDGTVVWKEEGHNQKRDGVKKAIDAALGG